MQCYIKGSYGKGVELGGDQMRKYTLDEAKLARDNYTYDKENNPEIDICLSCTLKTCRGKCDKIKISKRTRARTKMQEKKYIIRRRYTTAEGFEKTSYFQCIYKLKNRKKPTLKCGVEIFHAKKFTYEEAEEAVKQCKELTGDKVTYEIILRSEEIEKIGKENRKTKRRAPAFRVDSNGNILGKLM